MSLWWTRGGRNKEEERIKALEQAVEGLKRDNKVIRLEWEDVYDRLTRTMGRLNARIRKSETLESPESDDKPAPGAPPSPPTPVGEHAILAQHRARRGA